MTAQQGFAIGVDLGTSNTVAVLRWPDGRTRPLLFDGVPVMPSAVYLDEAGTLHVGRDALRMAALDPARLEPNPKRRVDEATVLLGGVEVSTVDLLAAVLGVVARTAVEAVGFLPPAALTYPAAWGPRRREVLAAATGRAGWPPPRFVPEPVAAARYFADVLRRPVPVGRSLAVFDFGGGTLDIAVVRNAGPAGFEVVGSGGIPDLGGLDVDAALVNHLGHLLARTQPNAWRPLAAPGGSVELRQRRLFWDDVRGAKEMLSRTPIAPVAVPGVNDAVHLTREELDRVAGPLLQRAVLETAAVINRCGLRPDQLAGLFLVGGSSRLPIVARLLHSQLGIAPTVLEQPELPVAEGALAEVVPPPPPVAAAPPPTSGPPAPAPASASAPVPVSPPAAPPASGPPLVPAAQPFYRRKLTWLAGAAVLVVVAVVATVLVIVRNPYHEVNFVGGLSDPRRISMATDGYSVSSTFTAFFGDMLYLAHTSADKTLTVQGLDPTKSAAPWHTAVTAESTSSVQWNWIQPWSGGVLVSASRYTSDGSVNTLYAVSDQGKPRWHQDYDDNDHWYVLGGSLVWRNQAQHQVLSMNSSTGSTTGLVTDTGDESSQASLVVPVYQPKDFDGPGFPNGIPTTVDSRFVQVGGGGRAQVVDAATGAKGKSADNVGDTRDNYLAYDGHLYVGKGDSGYTIAAYDLDKMGSPAPLYTSDTSRQLQSIQPCGGLICLLDQGTDGARSTRLVALDPVSRKTWTRAAANASTVLPVGDRILLTPAATSSDDQFTTVYDPAGKLVSTVTGKAGQRVNNASALLFSAPSGDYATDESFTGYRVRSNRTVAMGEEKVRPDSCSWTETLLACGGEQEFDLWKITG